MYIDIMHICKSWRLCVYACVFAVLAVYVLDSGPLTCQTKADSAKQTA